MKPAQYLEFDTHIFETDDKDKIEFIRNLRGFGYEYIEIPAEEAKAKADKMIAERAPQIKQLGERSSEVSDLQEQVANLTEKLDKVTNVLIEMVKEKEAKSEDVPVKTSKLKKEVKQD